MALNVVGHKKKVDRHCSLIEYYHLDPKNGRFPNVLKVASKYQNRKCPKIFRQYILEFDAESNGPSPEVLSPLLLLLQRWDTCFLAYKGVYGNFTAACQSGTVLGLLGGVRRGKRRPKMKLRIKVSNFIFRYPGPLGTGKIRSNRVSGHFQ